MSGANELQMSGANELQMSGANELRDQRALGRH